jgi:hypothetical protein
LERGQSWPGFLNQCRNTVLEIAHAHHARAREKLTWFGLSRAATLVFRTGRFGDLVRTITSATPIWHGASNKQAFHRPLFEPTVHVHSIAVPEPEWSDLKRSGCKPG